jgi:hypothetical protein
MPGGDKKPESETGGYSPPNLRPSSWSFAKPKWRKSWQRFDAFQPFPGYRGLASDHSLGQM